MYVVVVFAVDSLFLVTLNTHENSISHDDIVSWDEPVLNPGSSFDFSIHAYVAPVDGYYQ